MAAIKNKLWKGKILLLAIVGCLTLFSSNASATTDILGPVRTDPSDSTNPFVYMGDGSNPTQILPKALSNYAPSGSFLDRWGFGAAGTPPNPSAVDTVIMGLVQACIGKSKLSKGIWGFAMAIVIFGCTLSGFITFKAISAGKESPGLGSVKWLGKTMMAILLVHFVAASIPRTLLSICDSISSEAGEWLPGGAKITENALYSISQRIKLGYQTQLASWVNEVAVRVKEKYKDSPQESAKIEAALMLAAQDMYNEFERAQGRAMLIAKKKDISADDASALISDEFKQGMTEGMETFMKQMDKGFASIGADAEIRKNMLGRPTVDLAGIAYPVKIIRTAIYIAVTYIAISIWGMPLAILMWAAIFSLPSQWGMGNILYSGIKIFFTILLSMILVMIYTSATLSGEQERLAKLEGWDWINPVEVTKKVIAGTDTKIGSFITALSGATTDLIIASILIITAPAQAAAIVKGANGAAESAKNAMMGGGGAYGTQQAMGGAFGTQGFGFGGSSLGGGTSGGGVSLGDFQRIQGPTK